MVENNVIDANTSPLAVPYRHVAVSFVLPMSVANVVPAESVAAGELKVKVGGLVSGTAGAHVHRV